MDVDSDGSDSDRVPLIDGSSPTFQPLTSYRWPKRTATPNQFLAPREEKLRRAAKRAARENRRAKGSGEKPDRGAEGGYRAAQDRFLPGRARTIPTSSCRGRSRGKRANPFSPGVGDYCAVIYKNVIYPAIVGDVGPANKMGEASLRIAQQMNSLRHFGEPPESKLKVTYLVFPGTAERPFGPPDLAHWREKIDGFLKEMGGYNAQLFTWKDLTAPTPTPTPPPTPTPTPSPSPSATVSGTAAASASPLGFRLGRVRRSYCVVRGIERIGSQPASLRLEHGNRGHQIHAPAAVGDRWDGWRRPAGGTPADRPPACRYPGRARPRARLRSGAPGRAPPPRSRHPVRGNFPHDLFFAECSAIFGDIRLQSSCHRVPIDRLARAVAACSTMPFSSGISVNWHALPAVVSPTRIALADLPQDRRGGFRRLRRIAIHQDDDQALEKEATSDAPYPSCASVARFSARSTCRKKCEPKPGRAKIAAGRSAPEIENDRADLRCPPTLQGRDLRPRRFCRKARRGEDSPRDFRKVSL